MADEKNEPKYPPLFEPGTNRVSQAFLDLLNGESAKMTAAVQNPDNHDRIIAAAQQAPSYIADLEAEMGMTHPAGQIGPMEAHYQESQMRELDDLLEAANKPADDPTFAHIWPPDEEATERTRRGLIIAIAVACVCVVALWYACAHAAQYDFATPTPDLSAQSCILRSHDNILTISCDSSHVCPPGWALHTQMIPPLSGRTLEEILGYGDATEVTNSCVTAGQGISTDGGRHYEASVGVMK